MKSLCHWIFATLAITTTPALALTPGNTHGHYILSKSDASDISLYQCTPQFDASKGEENNQCQELRKMTWTEFQAFETYLKEKLETVRFVRFASGATGFTASGAAGIGVFLLLCPNMVHAGINLGSAVGSLGGPPSSTAFAAIGGVGGLLTCGFASMATFIGGAVVSELVVVPRLVGQFAGEEFQDTPNAIDLSKYTIQGPALRLVTQDDAVAELYVKQFLAFYVGKP